MSQSKLPTWTMAEGSGSSQDGAGRPASLWGQAEIPWGQAQIHGVRPFRRRTNCDDKARPLGPDPANSGFRPDPSPARREFGANRGVSRAPFAPTFEESCSEVSEARASRSSWFRCSEVKLRNTGTPEQSFRRQSRPASAPQRRALNHGVRPVRWGQAKWGQAFSQENELR